jgi:hypothetical protein
MHVKRGFYFEIKKYRLSFNGRIERGREGKREWMSELIGRWRDR